MNNAADKTLKSLKKVNDFPFYTAMYHGNYKLIEYKNGAIKSRNDIIPFFEDLFTKLGKPIKLQLPTPTEINIGCSAFYYKNKDNNSIIGKNLDWQRDPILLLKTDPEIGYKSLSMANLRFCDIFQLNSFEHNLLLAPYVPLDGINEHGLVITMLSVHSGSNYPHLKDKISVGDYNIIRIVLDTCKNIDETINIFKNYNLIQTGLLPLHYLVADKEESCIIEFFDGEIKIKRNSKKNYLTNFLKLKNDENENINICSRYDNLKKILKNRKKDITKREAKEILNDVSVYKDGYEIPSTIWSVIYDQQNLKMNIKIGKSSTYYSVGL